MEPQLVCSLEDIRSVNRGSQVSQLSPLRWLSTSDFCPLNANVEHAQAFDDEKNVLQIKHFGTCASHQSPSGRRTNPSSHRPLEH